MKVVTAQFIYESNTFNPREAAVELFTRGGTWLTEADDIRRWTRHSDSQLGGSLAVLESAGCDTEPVAVIMSGTPAGRLSASCHEIIRDTLRDRLRAALPADAVLLHLHGAVCAADEDDVEGALLAMVREDLGFRGRLVVSLDLHANVTPRMLRHADAVTAYRTFPHQDFYATGERAAALVLDPRPTVRALARIAAIIPPTSTHHAQGHFKLLLERARELERRPGILDVSLCPVQPWLDIGELGTSVVVTATSTAAAAEAQRLAEAWWAQRSHWQPKTLAWSEILQTLRPRADRPWFLVDTADATTGGADGASAEAVMQLWPHRDELPGDVLLWVVDPAAVAAARDGATTFRLGSHGFPVQVDVIFTGECRYRARGQAYTGQEFSSGASAVLRRGRLSIAVTSQGALCADPAFYECLGLSPATALAVQVKSLLGWQAGYGVEAARGLPFDGPGSTSLHFARLPFTGERRELFPFCDTPPTPLTLWQSI